jgi:hypothetical protein
MSKRGRPIKPGERYPSGDLKRQHDPGSAGLLARRTEVVGEDRAGDQRAGYRLGILYLRGALKSVHHVAGLRYARLHDLVHGNGFPPSQLAVFTAGTTRGPTSINEPRPLRRLLAAADDPERLKRLSDAIGELRRADAVLLALGTRRPYNVLQNIAVYEREMRFTDTSRSRSPAAWAADLRDLKALKQATAALARHWGLGEHREKRAAD